MKKLFFIILLLISGFMFGQAKFEHATLFPEKVCWTVQGRVLYGDYADSEKGRFKKVIKQTFESPTGVKIWIIEYPTVHIRYTIRIKGNVSVINKEKIK
jgi:hypothetical protein